MKKIALILLACTMVFAACKKEKKPTPPSLDGSVVGSWHLVSWTGSSVVQDVYISFEENGGFDLYQRIDAPYYEHFDGVYTVNGTNMTGHYSDGVEWDGSPYKITFSDEGKTMSMTRSSNPDDVSVYAKTDIPDDILSGILVGKAVLPVSDFRYL